MIYLKLEGDGVCPEVGVKLCVDVDTGRLPSGILHNEEQLGDDLDHVAGLEDKVPLPLHCLGGKASRDVRLRPQLPRRRALKRK